MLFRKGIAIGIVLLFLVSVVPFIQGESNDVFEEFTVQEDSYRYMTDWSVHITNQTTSQETSGPFYNNVESRYIEPSPLGGLMDSAWPMQSHDVKHTGRSQYSTTGNPGAEIWRVRSDWAGEVESSAVIDNNIIYFGTMGGDHSLYALYPNGTRKWKYVADDIIWCTPAIADDGTIYFETWGGYLHALYPNGTKKWSFTPWNLLKSSPAIGDDGTIYFGCDNNNIYAVNANGTEKWHYVTEYFINSAPAIGDDGTIYIGSGDGYLYALYQNGTLRWRYRTGDWIKGNPSIAEDGTIYVPSFDGYLYALYPNGTMKWRASTGSLISAAGVALGEDGTIYVGTELLRAYFPNGTLKWNADVEGDIYGTVPAISADGTIYLSAGLDLVAVNPNGSIRWRNTIADTVAYSSPSIGPDGTVYVGSTWGGVWSYGYLHAFGLGQLSAEAGGPYQGTALCPITLTGLAFGGIPPYQYLWDFGDGNSSTEINPTHTYTTAGNYTAVFTITDSEGNSSSDSAMVTMDYPLPTLTIIKPTNGFYIADKQIFPFPFPFILGKITIQVTVEDHYNIDQVIICIRDDVVYTGTTPPYEWTWTQRNFRLKDNIYAIAYDVKGRYAEQRIEVTKLF